MPAKHACCCWQSLLNGIDAVEAPAVSRGFAATFSGSITQAIHIVYFLLLIFPSAFFLTVIFLGDPA